MGPAQGSHQGTQKGREWCLPRERVLGTLVDSSVRTGEPQPGWGSVRCGRLPPDVSDGGPRADTTVGPHSSPRGGVPALAVVTQKGGSKDTSCSHRGNYSKYLHY